MAKISRYFKSEPDRHTLPPEKTIYKLRKETVQPKLKDSPAPKQKTKLQIPTLASTIPKQLLQKYDKGDATRISVGIKTGVHKERFNSREEKIKYAIEETAKTEFLQREECGYLQIDAGETTTQFTQDEIIRSADISAAAKHFDLQLRELGPYRAKYTRNGRHLLLGGYKGHLAAFDWVTKKLHCEVNVMESVHDVCWLHVETMFAAAQKKWLYVYDNQGVEVHCVKKMHAVTRMEFLPYHFLLATCGDNGYLSWLDISLGEIVGQYRIASGRLNMMAQNPWNAVLCVGSAKGIVSMWAPKSHKPLAKMLCHRGPITALNVDPKGMYMATASINRELKIWDVRQLKGPLQQYRLTSPANDVSFAQRNYMLSVAMCNVVEIYRDCCEQTANKAYMRYRTVTPISHIEFCPYEDVLGVGHQKGFTSLLVPGAGEPHFDALEANPFRSKSQRREHEVKSLLEKIQPELIALDPTLIASVDVPTLREKIEAREKILHVKAPKIDYTSKKKVKGGCAKIAKNKKSAQEGAKMAFLKEKQELCSNLDINLIKESGANIEQKEYNPLDRFKTKKKQSKPTINKKKNYSL